MRKEILVHLVKQSREGNIFNLTHACKVVFTKLLMRPKVVIIRNLVNIGRPCVLACLFHIKLNNIINQFTDLFSFKKTLNINKLNIIYPPLMSFLIQRRIGIHQTYCNHLIIEIKISEQV